MGLIKSIYGKKIFIDTAPLIYYIEGNNIYTQKLNELFSIQSHCHFITSVITLSEVLVKPYREGNARLAKLYEVILTQAENIDIYEISIQIAEKSALLRAKYTIKTPDAIQIATAQYCSVDYFLTNDLRLKSINKLNVITLSEIFCTL